MSLSFMNRAWALGGLRAEGAEEARGADVVQVVLSWRDDHSGTVLSVHQVRAGRTLSLGEDGDVMLPSAVLGARHVEVLRYRGDTAMARVPEGAKLRVDGCETSLPPTEVEIVRGHTVEIILGAFVLRMARMRPLRRPSPSPFDSIRGGGAAVFLGSALLCAAAFSFVALMAPSLGAAEEDADDRDRIALMRHLLAAGDDMGRPLEVSSRPQGQEAAGRTSPAPTTSARPSGTIGQRALPSHGTPAAVDAPNGRAQLLSVAGGFGAVGLLRGASFDLAGLSARWDVHTDTDDIDFGMVGSMSGGDISDSFSTMGSVGIGRAANPIGLMGFGTLERVCERCVGGGSDAYDSVSGLGVGPSMHGSHRVRAPRIGGDEVAVNGRLPPEAIQRVVRQNDGRFRFCYENGLRANPTLAGRVTVKFVIDRHGAVAVASDGGSDLPDATVRQCVISSFTTLSFPEPANGTVMVVYPLVFSSAGPAEAEPLLQR